MSVRNRLSVATALLCAACSEQEPFSPTRLAPGEASFSSMIALACPSGWTEADRGAAVLRCKRTRSGSSTVEHVVFANLKAGARADMLFNASSSATRSTPSPDFSKTAISGWWQTGQARLGSFCAVSGTFFTSFNASTTKLSFPLKSGGVLRSTGSALDAQGARILSIRSDEAWISRFDLATTDFDKVSAALTEQNMVVGLPVPNATVSLRKGRNYVGLKDVDNDNLAETIFFFTSPSATEREAFNAVQGIGYRSIIQMDGSGSAQLNCKGTTLIPGDNRTIPQAFLITDARVPIHRSYKHSVPDHLYGHDPKEGASYGYVLEQANNFWLNASSGAGSVPIYRCLWGGNRHLVTRNFYCEGAGTREAVLGYGMTSQVPGSVPLHRLHNPRSGDHLYTTSETERQSVRAAGWTYEGITAFVWPN